MGLIVQSFFMNWLLALEILYAAALVFVCLRIIFDGRNNTKSLAYILLVIFIPLLGMFFYFSFGINYRKRKIYSKKIIQNADMARRLRETIYSH